MTVIVLSNTATTTWTVPADWNNANNTIEVIGGGGAGAGGGPSTLGGSGGGGGAYSRAQNVQLTPGVAVTVQVGAGGKTINASGTDTLVKNNSAATVALAKAGGGAEGISHGVSHPDGYSLLYLIMPVCPLRRMRRRGIAASVRIRPWTDFSCLD